MAIWEGIKSKLTLSNVLLLILFGILIYLLRFSFSSEILATGDLPGHYYLCEKMLSYLQQFRISGYDPIWYSGYPVFTFYNPLPYITVCFLHLISFKLLSLSLCFNLVLFSLPFLFLCSIYYTSNALFKNKEASIVAVILGFLVFLETSIGNYGVGIVAEYSAGFFSNCFAWPIFIFFIGVLEKLRQSDKKKYLFWSIGLLSALILSHIFTTIFAGLYLIFYTFFYFKESWKKIIIVIFSSIILTCFWWFPFLLNLFYSSGDDMSGETIGDPVIALFSQPIFGFFLLAFTIIGIVEMARKKRYLLPVFFLTSLIFLPRDIVNRFIEIPIHWYRFTAGIVVIDIFIAAYGLKYFLDNYIFSSKNNFILKTIVSWVFFIGVLIVIVPHFCLGIYENMHASERKYAKENSEIIKFLNDNKKDGKVFIDDNIVFFGGSGGPHYENMELGFNNVPVLGGLIYQSSLSYHYFGEDKSIFEYARLISDETKPYEYSFSNSFQNMELDNLTENIANKNSEAIKLIIKNLSTYGVKYILTSNTHHTPILDFANSSFNNNFVSVTTNEGPYVLIRINAEPQSLISSTRYKPFLFIQNGIFNLNFKEFSKNWYRDGYSVEHPVIYSRKSFRDLPEYELSQMGGYIIIDNKCPTSDIDFLTKRNKPIIIVGAPEECVSNFDNVYFVAKRIEPEDVKINKERNDLELKRVEELYKNIYSIVLKSDTEGMRLEKIEPEIIENEYLKFNSTSGTIINYSYFPKWQSIDSSQTIFWATPSRMFIFGSGNENLRYK